MRLEDEPVPADDAADALRQANAVAGDQAPRGLGHLAESDLPDALDPRVGMPVEDPLDDPRQGPLDEDDLGHGTQG